MTELGTRSFVTVAYARELIEAPELLGAYAARFGDGDDATLVLYAPDEDPASSPQRCGPRSLRRGPMAPRVLI